MPLKSGDEALITGTLVVFYLASKQRTTSARPGGLLVPHRLTA